MLIHLLISTVLYILIQCEKAESISTNISSPHIVPGDNKFDLAECNGSPESGGSTAQREVEYLNRILNKFIQNNSFDDIAFSRVDDLIEAYFKNISESIEKAACNKIKVLIQWKIQKHRFYSMRATAKLIESLDSTKMEYMLIKRALRLNVQLFGLFDLDGELDLRVNKYEEKIDRFVVMLQTWEELFDNIIDVPKQVSDLFETILSECVKKIQTLWRSIEKKKVANA